MTLISFGCVVPIHMDMLNLVGFEFSGLDMNPTKNSDSRKAAMRQGLQSLRKITGVDYGYDPQAWRDFLIRNGEEYGYTHPYAYEDVDRAVLAAMKDQEVIATLSELTNLT